MERSRSVVRLCDEDDLFDFDDDRLLRKLETLFGDDDLPDGQKAGCVDILSPEPPDATE